MTFLLRTVLTLLFIHGAPQSQDGKTAQSEKPRTASISGKVTLAGEPAPGVRVTLVVNDSHTAIARAKTDGDGRYSMDSLPSGYYSVEVRSPSYVALGHSPNLSENITLQEGKKIDKLDFSLVKGGVITGRVTDPDGSPLTGLIPNLKRIDEKGQPLNDSLPYMNEFETDDRGIYRIYGIPAGRYIVGFGREKLQNSQYGVIKPAGTKDYSLTFYPGVSDEARSKILEVSAGSEITGIDIRFTEKEITFKVSGRMIDANTDNQSANIFFRLYMLTSEGRLTSTSFDGKSDARGTFKLDSLQPGKYFVKVEDDGKSVFSDQVPFEITDTDVEGLVVKVHQGLTIRGYVTLDGVDHPNAITMLRGLQLYLASRDPNNTDNYLLNYSQGDIEPDLSFTLKGVRPGSVVFSLNSSGPEENFAIKFIDIPNLGRITADVNMPATGSSCGPVEIPEGQNLAGVHVVIGTIDGSIHGEVKLSNLPKTGRLMTMVRIIRTDIGSQDIITSARLDADGKFVIKGLPTGEYKLTISVYEFISQDSNQADTYGRIGEVVKNVSVQNGQETQVTLTLILKPLGTSEDK